MKDVFPRCSAGEMLAKYLLHSEEEAAVVCRNHLLGDRPSKHYLKHLADALKNTMTLTRYREAEMDAELWFHRMAMRNAVGRVLQKEAERVPDADPRDGRQLLPPASDHFS